MAGSTTDGTAFLYARHASAGFNTRMHSWLTALSGDVRRTLGDNLIALVLGGGYGRGEGGVLVNRGANRDASDCGASRAPEEQPYNDLDLVLIVHRKAPLPWDELKSIQHKYEALTGIQVDFSQPLSVEDVRAWRPTLMWSDLLHGHCVLDGPPDILTANAPEMPAAALALVEATRLMLNRGSGLLWAMRIDRGYEPAPDADFIRRNFYKCALTLGDALLIAHGRHSALYTGRGERLSRLIGEMLIGEMPQPFSFDLAPIYETALTFKFWPGEFAAAPGGPHLAELARQWGEIFLYVENRRAHRLWRRMDEYVRCRDTREAEQNTFRKWPRNFVRSRQAGVWSIRYPRERLYRELPVLLGLCESSVPDWEARSGRFLAVWKQVN